MEFFSRRRSLERCAEARVRWAACRLEDHPSRKARDSLPRAGKGVLLEAAGVCWKGPDHPCRRGVPRSPPKSSVHRSGPFKLDIVARPRSVTDPHMALASKHAQRPRKLLRGCGQEAPGDS
jgi:hypothetical protein